MDGWMDRIWTDREKIFTSVSSSTVFTTGISASLLSFFLPHVLIRPLCLCLDLWPRCSESWLCCSSFYLVVRPHLLQPLHPPPPPPLKYIGTLNHDYTKVLQYFFKIKHQIAMRRKKKVIWYISAMSNSLLSRLLEDWIILMLTIKLRI